MSKAFCYHCDKTVEVAQEQDIVGTFVEMFLTDIPKPPEVFDLCSQCKMFIRYMEDGGVFFNE